MFYITKNTHSIHRRNFDGMEGGGGCTGQKNRNAAIITKQLMVKRNKIVNRPVRFITFALANIYRVYSLLPLSVFVDKEAFGYINFELCLFV